MWVIVLLAISVNPASNVLEETVDLAEINHFYDDQCRLVFDQIIYYDWDDRAGRYQIVDWRLLKTSGQIPLRDWQRNRYTSVWHDFKQRDVLRRVHCNAVRETWTQYDPELVEREYLPQEARRGLKQYAPRKNRRSLDASRIGDPGFIGFR